MKAKWSKAEDAPIGERVLVWIAPVMISKGICLTPARMEVGFVRQVDPRSKQVTMRYRRDAMWTPLPKPPE